MLAVYLMFIIFQLLLEHYDKQNSVLIASMDYDGHHTDCRWLSYFWTILVTIRQLLLI